MAPEDREEWLAAVVEATLTTDPTWQRTLMIKVRGASTKTCHAQDLYLPPSPLHLQICKADGKIQLILAKLRAISQPDGSSRIIICTEPAPPSRCAHRSH